MAKIKRKKLKALLEYDIRSVEGAIPYWKELYADDPVKLKEQLAYMEGMIFAYEHLIAVYELEKKEA